MLRGSHVGLAKAVEPMAQAHEGVFPKHARARVAHDRLYLVAAGTLVTMHRTFGASWLFDTEAATVKAYRRIIQERLALAAQSVVRRVMMIAAVNVDHGLHGSPFARQPTAPLRQGGRDRRLQGGAQLRCICRFKSHRHAVILVQTVRIVFDRSQNSEGIPEAGCGYLGGKSQARRAASFIFWQSSEAGAGAGDSSSWFLGEC